ncbi:MAG: quinolinate synthase NadA [Alphaproteobacteria bacterium]|nr:quinolinate synthase NadA [Alphaproteobacteria bacterium]
MLDQLHARLKNVITPEAWASFAPDIEAIHALKKEKKAVILAHNYMTPEIFHGVADIVGDSLALARQAAALEADVILMAGVHFMAETAKLMNPTRMVLIPDLEAGCSLAESITPEDILALRARYPDVPIVTYVNTSAAVKALCDICCTSGNAKQVVESLGAPRVIMVPDAFLAANTAAQTDVEIIPWQGICLVHERFTPQDVHNYRQTHKGVAIIAHPECPPDVVKASDFAGSTVKMIEWVETHKPEKVVLLTEGSMSDNIAIDHPDLTFIQPCQFCPYMKKITLASIRRALETMTHPIDIPAAIAAPARKAVERMIKVS